MPLFELSKSTLSTVEQTNFSLEKELQSLVEENLETVFNCRFVATEFSTGALHAGRIDSLALSEDNNPVIIEYKKVQSSELINQSLFYLSWIQDHKGDFEIAVQQKLGADVKVDWSDVRVICIAPNYKKYDLHAVQVMGANIELWSYRLFTNGFIYFEEVFQKNYTKDNKSKLVNKNSSGEDENKDIQHTFEQHVKGKPQNIVDIALAIQEYVLSLDPAMDESPRKFYVAYKISQNIVCMELQKQRVLLYLKLNPSSIDLNEENIRDVSSIGHYGTGNLEVSLKSIEEIEVIDLLLSRYNNIEVIKPLIIMAYQKVGG